MNQLYLLPAMAVPVLLAFGYFMPNHPVWCIVGWLYKPVNYIYSMTIYHLLVPLYLLVGIVGFKPQTMVGLDAGNIAWAGTVNHDILAGSVSNIFFAVLVVIIDLFFFLAVWYEFPQLGLTAGKISVLEVMIFSIALYSPGLRVTMMFLSLNTIQIMVFYKLAKLNETYFSKFPIVIFLVVTGGYILLFKVLFFPIQLYFRGG